MPIRTGDAGQRHRLRADSLEGGLMLTPNEIRVKEFLTSLRGYDTDEVRSFLETLADSLESERAASAVAAAGAPAVNRELETKITRLTEELELALWTMRRLEAAVHRLEERLDQMGDSTTPTT